MCEHILFTKSGLFVCKDWSVWTKTVCWLFKRENMVALADIEPDKKQAQLWACGQTVCFVQMHNVQ